jgi:dolichol-phosphate mannosyltransferase
MQHVLHRQFELGVAFSPIEFCVVVPVLNERGNVSELIRRVETALLGIE